LASVWAGLLPTAAPTRAAEPLTIGLGGRLREFFFVADQASAPPEKLNPAGQFTEALIAAEAKTTLADGTTIRAYGRYDIANQNSQNLNQAFVDIGTGVGRFRIGTNFDANTYVIGDPVPEALFTVDEELLADVLRPRTGITMRDALTFKRFVENAAGVSYQTPLFSGFRIGLTYHPTTSAPSPTTRSMSPLITTVISRAGLIAWPAAISRSRRRRSRSPPSSNATRRRGIFPLV
jgi:hypothetical protein